MCFFQTWPGPRCLFRKWAVRKHSCSCNNSPNVHSSRCSRYRHKHEVALDYGLVPVVVSLLSCMTCWGNMVESTGFLYEKPNIQRSLWLCVYGWVGKAVSRKLLCCLYSGSSVCTVTHASVQKPSLVPAKCGACRAEVTTNWRLTFFVWLSLSNVIATPLKKRLSRHCRKFPLKSCFRCFFGSKDLHISHNTPFICNMLFRFSERVQVFYRFCARIEDLSPFKCVFTRHAPLHPHSECFLSAGHTDLSPTQSGRFSLKYSQNWNCNLSVVLE